MKIKSFLPGLSLFAFLAFAFSCSDQKKESNANNFETEISEDLKQKVDLDTVRSVSLSERSKKATEDWMKYIALNSEIKRLEDYTVLDIINNAGTIENVIDSISGNVPEIFDTKAVNARIVTLKTHSRLLKENADRIEPDATEIKKLSAKLKRDFNNLKIQLNEVFIIEDSSFQLN